MCYKCYKSRYKQKTIICKECGRKREHRAFGLCGGCHTRLYHYDKIRNFNYIKRYGIGLNQITALTKLCIVCGFSKIVDLHHLDGDNKNNSDRNLIGLCPNCHKMIHSYKYYNEISDKLKEIGYNVDKIHPSSYVFRRDEKKR